VLLCAASAGVFGRLQQLLHPGLLGQHPMLGQQQQQRLGVLTHAKRGDVLLVAEGISKTHDGEKILFNNLTVSVL
jgi:hypothetical protein